MPAIRVSVSTTGLKERGPDAWSPGEAATHQQEPAAHCPAIHLTIKSCSGPRMRRVNPYQGAPRLRCVRPWGCRRAPSLWRSR